MSRYGRTSAKAIEQAYPHIVEMIVPLGGFGKKLDDMYQWHWARNIEAMRGCGWRDKSGRSYFLATSNEEDLLIHEVSDEALEAAGGNEVAARYTLAACTGLSVCPG
jgi:hypothetical protein